MSLFARLNFLRYTTLLYSTKKFSEWSVQKIKQYPAHLMLPVGFCLADEEFNMKHFKEIEIPDRPLTHKHLIQQACSESVHTATRILTQTLVAIKDIGLLYRESMEDLIHLLNETLQRTKNNIDINDLNDSLVAARAKVEELNKSIVQLSSLMEYVEKLVKSTADTAFIAGADTVCNAMCERLQFAQNELSDDLLKNKKLRQEFELLEHAINLAEIEKEKLDEENNPYIKNMLSEDKMKNKQLEEEYLVLHKLLIESEIKGNGDKSKEDDDK